MEHAAVYQRAIYIAAFLRRGGYEYDAGEYGRAQIELIEDMFGRDGNDVERDILDALETAPVSDDRPGMGLYEVEGWDSHGWLHY